MRICKSDGPVEFRSPKDKREGVRPRSNESPRDGPGIDPRGVGTKPGPGLSEMMRRPEDRGANERSETGSSRPERAIIPNSPSPKNPGSRGTDDGGRGRFSDPEVGVDEGSFSAGVSPGSEGFVVSVAGVSS